MFEKSFIADCAAHAARSRTRRNTAPATSCLLVRAPRVPGEVYWQLLVEPIELGTLQICGPVPVSVYASLHDFLAARLGFV